MSWCLQQITPLSTARNSRQHMKKWHIIICNICICVKYNLMPNLNVLINAALSSWKCVQSYQLWFICDILIIIIIFFVCHIRAHQATNLRPRLPDASLPSLSFFFSKAISFHRVVPSLSKTFRCALHSLNNCSPSCGSSEFWVVSLTVQRKDEKLAPEDCHQILRTPVLRYPDIQNVSGQ